LVQRAESGQRGYLLTGREMYLAPYEQAIQELPAALDEMGVRPSTIRNSTVISF
jgi:CHASE3 domain sensor protein